MQKKKITEEELIKEIEKILYKLIEA